MKIKILILATLFFSIKATAYEWSVDSHDVFRGDINGDGIEDILLKAKSIFQNYEIPYGIDVPVKVNINAQKNVILYGQAGSSNSFVMDFNPLPSLVGDDSWNPAPWGSLEANIVIEDLDGDGKNDLYLATNLNGNKYAVLTSSGDNEIPELKLPQSDSIPDIFELSRSDSTPVASTSTSIGKLTGSHSVSPNGKFNYAVSFNTLPSVAGILPSLGASYSGSNANGPLGVGWYLTGLSKITRCGTMYSKHGFVDGVNYDASDRFCLNGEPLIAINGSYGANGAEYRTERDTHAKIISYGTEGSGPAYFRIWQHDGKIAEYGSSIDSKLKAGSKGIHTWAQNTLEDRENNTVDFAYTSTEGELLIASISYANGSHEVEYNYETRNDKSSHNRDGLAQLQTERLNSVKILLNGSVVRMYKFGYEYGQQSNVSRIRSISECYSSSSCFPETTFYWEDGPNSHIYTSKDHNVDSTQYTSGRQYSNFTQLIGDVEMVEEGDVVNISEKIYGRHL